MPNSDFRLMQAALEVSATVVRLWGPGVIGSALVHCFYSNKPWRSVRELGEYVEISEAQLRRRLDTLEKLGRVVTKVEGKTKLYAAEPKIAKRTVNVWREFCRKLQSANIG